MHRLLAVLVVAACGSSPKQPPQQPQPQTPPTAEPTKPTANAGKSIGVATMLDDGTLQLMLRAEGEGGMVGDALIRYPPTHDQYQEVLKHLGGMKPGESKPVPPWPDEPKQ